MAAEAVEAEVGKKSYFYVLTEQSKCRDLEERLLSAFHDFKEAHEDDSEVILLTPNDDDFENARSTFGISQTPAFVIADEPEKLEKGTNPFISFNRPAIVRATQDDGRIFNLITDIHYLLIDDDILNVKKELTKTYLLKLFKKM